MNLTDYTTQFESKIHELSLLVAKLSGVDVATLPELETALNQMLSIVDDMPKVSELECSLGSKLQILEQVAQILPSLTQTFRSKFDRLMETVS